MVNYVKKIIKKGYSEEVRECGFKYFIYFIKIDLIGFSNLFVIKNVLDFGLCIK